MLNDRVGGVDAEKSIIQCRKRSLNKEYIVLISNKRPVGLIVPPFIIGFLENVSNVTHLGLKLGSRNWSLFAQIHMKS